MNAHARRGYPLFAALFVAVLTPHAVSGQPQFPDAVAAETRRLVFQVSTPRSAGTTEAQARAALDDVFTTNGAASVARLRVFAVDRSDLAAIAQVIDAAFRRDKRPMPAVSLVGVASFPFPGQRVLIESTIVSREIVNPHGVAFLAGLAAAAGDQTIRGLATVASAGGVAPADVLRVSCFYEHPDQIASAQSAIAATFPAAAASFVRSYAAAPKPLIECEAIARLQAEVDGGVRIFNLPTEKPSPFYSRGALVSTARVALTGGFSALAEDDAALRVPMQRARQAVEGLGGKMADVVLGDNYWLTAPARDGIRLVRPSFFGATVPAATGVFFTSLLEERATISVEFVVALR